MGDGCFFTVSDMIGDYEIIKSLGTFPGGEVYLVKHKMLQIQSVARIFFSQELLHDNQSEFLHRMQSLYTLRHPNIVGVTFFAQYPDKNFSAVFSEYAEGTTVAGYMKSNPGGMAVSQALEIVGKISSALGEISAHGLLHGNIRPSNIFLTADHGVKLSDLERACSDKPFAFAAAAANPEQLPALEVLPYYAPEIGLTGAADIRSDIYSIGMILYLMLAGKLPFRSQINVLLIGEILYAELPAPGSIRKEIPPALDKFVLRLTAKKPEDRPQTPEQLQQELSALLQELAGKPAESAPKAPEKTVPAPPKNGVPKLQLRMPSAVKSPPAAQASQMAHPPVLPAVKSVPARQPSAVQKAEPKFPPEPPKAKKNEASARAPEAVDFGETKGNEDLLVREVNGKLNQQIPLSWKTLPSILGYVLSKSAENTKYSFKNFFPVILLCCGCCGVVAFGLYTDMATLLCGAAVRNDRISAFRAFQALPNSPNPQKQKLYRKILAGEGDFTSIRFAVRDKKEQECIRELCKHEEPDACLIAATLEMLQPDKKGKKDEFLPLLEKAAELGSLEAASFLQIWHQCGGDPKKAETYKKLCLVIMQGK